MLCLVVALPAEARPITRRLALAAADSGPFRVFEGEATALVVSGVGRVAAAAATAYLWAHVGRPKDAVWIDVGIAGHPTAPLGTPFVAHRVIDGSSRRSWYPPLVGRPSFGSATVVSVDRPETDYVEDALYEMEAAGFWPTANRFATAELVHVVKVVSDNRESSIDAIDGQRVGEWIDAAWPAIEEFAGMLRNLRQRHVESPVRSKPLADWRRLHRFSFTESKRLESLLRRADVLGVETDPEALEFRSISSAAEALARLEERLRTAPTRIA